MDLTEKQQYFFEYLQEKITDNGCAPSLREAAEDPDFTIRMYAQDALRHIKGDSSRVPEAEHHRLRHGSVLRNQYSLRFSRFQFPAALFLKGSDRSAVTRIFSSDLVGAAFGTLLISTLLLPFFGFIGCTVGLIGIKLASLAVTGLSHAKN